MSANTKQHLTQKLRYILCLSLVANFIILLILCGLIAYKEIKKNEKLQTNHNGIIDSQTSLPADSGVCILCDYLGKNISTKDTLYDKIETTKDGHRICCTNKPSFLPQLVGKMLMTEKERAHGSDDTDDIKRQLQWWRSRPGSIHMHLDLDKLKDDKFVWKTDDDSLGLAHQSGIELNTTSSSIVVPRKALYFVYVAISFDFDDITSVPIFYHTVTRSHPLLPLTVNTLLMNKYGGSADSDRKYTSFLCGTFQMQGSFNIKTELSSYEYVSRKKYASYFGMFRVGNV